MGSSIVAAAVGVVGRMSGAMHFRSVVMRRMGASGMCLRDGCSFRRNFGFRDGNVIIAKEVGPNIFVGEGKRVDFLVRQRSPLDAGSRSLSGDLSGLCQCFRIPEGGR